MRCSHCGGSNFDEDRARADLVCLDCGMVLSENVISSEVEFVETSAGVSSAVGRFVSDESQVVGRESRQVTENKARRRIDTICGHLRLGNDIAVSAFRYYQSALFRGITRGRGALQVAAGCVYLAARQLRVNLMLLDLSDAVGVNVYILGHCYNDLKRRLHLVIPEMDPCMYIERFASQLEFGDKTPVVSTTAMRLLQRMKKDWISTGRRPSGLAAAALLVAARIHEFNRNEEDVARIARISQKTALKRLREFSCTPSSALSIEAFFTVDYEEEHDPPAFLASKRSEDTINEMDEANFAKISAEINELERRIDCDLQMLMDKRARKRFGGKVETSNVGGSKGLHHLFENRSSTEPTSTPTNIDGCAIKGFPPRNVLREVLDGIVDPSLLDTCVKDLQILTEHSGDQVCEMLRNAEETRDLLDSKLLCVDPLDNSLIDQPVSSDTKLADMKPAKLPSFLPSANATKMENANSVEGDGVLSLDGIDDDELEQEYLLKPREVMIKAAVWYKSNAEYLQSSRAKRLAKLKHQNEESKDPPKRARRSAVARPRNRGITVYNGSSKIESINEDSIDKPMSRKINYDALEALVGSSSSTTTPSIMLPNADTCPSDPLQPGPLLAATLNLNEHKSITSAAITNLSVNELPLTTTLKKKSVTFVSQSDSEPTSSKQTEITPITSVPPVTNQPSDNHLNVILDDVDEDEAEELQEDAVEDFYEDFEDDDPSTWEQGDELW